MNAKEARIITNNTSDQDLDAVYKSIKREATKGNNNLHWYKSLNKIQLDKLLELGYDIFHHPSMAIQKDSLYYTIKW
jgi:hypothetical protein